MYLQYGVLYLILTRPKFAVPVYRAGSVGLRKPLRVLSKRGQDVYSMENHEFGSNCH